MNKIGKNSIPNNNNNKAPLTNASTNQKTLNIGFLLVITFHPLNTALILHK
jgi:hypothetical protein